MARSITGTELGILKAVPELLSKLLELNTTGKFDAITTGDEFFGTFSLARRSIKPFIIGFIPPDIAVNFIPVERNQTELSALITAPAQAPNVPPPDISSGSAKINKRLPDSFYRKFAAMCSRLGASPADMLLVLFSESGLRADAANHRNGDKKNGLIQARGLNQITPGACSKSGLSKSDWENNYSNLSEEDQLPYVEKYFKSSYKGPYVNPDQLYVVNFAPAYVQEAQNRNAVLYPKFNKDGKTINDKWKQNEHVNPNGDITVGDLTASMYKNADRADFKSYLAALENVIGVDAAHARPDAPSGAASPAPTTTSSGTNSAPGAPSGKTVGSIMMGGNVTDIESDDPLRRVGRNIKISETRTAVVKKQVDELNRQILAVQNIPPLLMLINPSSFSRSYEATVDKPKARSGHVVHMWLERPLTISSSGQSAGQYVTDASGSGGLTNSNRLHSLSYKNLMSLALMYKNNGNIFSGNSVDSLAAAGNVGIPVISMSMYIYYDGHIYIGSFDDFSITDAAEKPFTMSYSWKFTCRYDIDVTAVTDTIINRVLAGSTRAGAQ